MEWTRCNQCEINLIYMMSKLVEMKRLDHEFTFKQRKRLGSIVYQQKKACCKQHDFIDYGSPHHAAKSQLDGMHWNQKHIGWYRIKTSTTEDGGTSPVTINIKYFSTIGKQQVLQMTHKDFNIPVWSKPKLDYEIHWKWPILQWPPVY